ncbi:MAG: phosphatidylglycerol lysyltransferase domain-containing protein [Pseudomonadota bacterium]
MTEPSQPLSNRIRAARFDRAPRYLAVITFLVGALALISAAIPNPSASGKAPLQRLILETPVMALTLGGSALMLMSLGLARRLQSAWVLSVFLALHGIVATLFLRPRPLEFAMYFALFAVLFLARKSFFRRSSLLTIIIPRIWILASFCALLVASFFALLWVSHQSGFVEARFVDLLIDPALGAAGRPIAIAGILLGLTLLYFGIASPAWPKPKPASDEELRQISDLMQASDQTRPDNLLAYVGDKSVYFGPERKAAIMYSDINGTRIAMSVPIGPRAAWASALEEFRSDAEAKGLRPAIYSAPPDLLPDLHDLGFKFEKIGENAILDLPAFTLSGRKREVIRRSRRKLAERQEATFDLSLPPHRSSLLDELKTISDLWLAQNGGREKSFSLGRYDPAFLAHCPIGLVQLKGRIVAFGSLLVTPDQSWAGIDLMRYDPDAAVTNTMDFLLVELILWARETGYRKFDLAMAPLSGLVEEEVAPLFARIGQFVFERGERFYNFQGLRRFKQKFDPDWEPRYLAATGYWSLPIILAQVAILTNGQSARREDQQVETLI